MKIVVDAFLLWHYNTPIFAHYRLGLVYFFRDTLAKAIKELESAAEYTGETSTPRKLIYEALAKCFKRMGLEEESRHYAGLAESAQ
jgi:hypothetical protein